MVQPFRGKAYGTCRKFIIYIMEGTAMQHKGTVLIETDRLILRKFRMDDGEAAFENWTRDKKVTEFLRWSTHTNIETAKSLIKKWVDGYERDNFYQWAIVLKSGEDRPIGTISVVEQNENLNILHIGYCIGSRWWHQGITSEAFSAIISFLFEEVKANRIEAQHDPLNPNSGKVMEKCGLRYEGTLREADTSNRGIVNVSVYSILASEYFAK